MRWARSSSSRAVAVGWVAHGTLDGNPRAFRTVPPPVSMRIVNVARWINRNSTRVRNEMYRSNRRYDIVVFFKTMDAKAQREVALIQAYGGRVVFDANVNYYETWGDYTIEGTRPTPRQQADAIAITRMADSVVADSSYLLDIVQELNERAVWIPDNVDTRIFRGLRRHVARRVTRLVWSGVAKKALHLLEIEGVLGDLEQVELVVVSDERPAVLAELERVVPCRFVPFTERRYARVLRRCDIVVSPRALGNAYDRAHTEYKITLGMAVGLPAVASPQRSYVEAIGHAGGGIVAESQDEWREALKTLVSEPGLRAELGARAARTVRDRYATPVVARRYLELLCTLA